jgi:molybdenum cofactor guanylyltransferase
MGPHRVAAAVLAGGRGERLGKDKPAALIAGRPMIWHPLRAAADAGLEAFVVAKRRTRLPDFDVPVLREPDEPTHPLCGVVEALAFASGLGAGAVLLLACDMPFVTGPLLGWMAARDGAVTGRLDGRRQPFPARVPVGALPLLRRALAQSRPLGAALEELSPEVIDERQLRRFGEPRRLCFNVNDGEDLRAAAEWLACSDV